MREKTTSAQLQLCCLQTSVSVYCSLKSLKCFFKVLSWPWFLPRNSPDAHECIFWSWTSSLIKNIVVFKKMKLAFVFFSEWDPFRVLLPLQPPAREEPPSWLYFSDPAQSPQLSQQMCICADFDRVFCMGPGETADHLSPRSPHLSTVWRHWVNCGPPLTEITAFWWTQIHLRSQTDLPLPLPLQAEQLQSCEPCSHTGTTKRIYGAMLSWREPADK